MQESIGCLAQADDVESIELPVECVVDHPLGACTRFEQPCPGGLAPETRLDVCWKVQNYQNRQSTPGGNLGGEVVEADCDVVMHVFGHGDLDALEEQFTFTAQIEVHYETREDGVIEKQVFIDGDQIFEPSESAFDTVLFAISGTCDGGACGETSLSEFAPGFFSINSWFDADVEIALTGAEESIAACVDAVACDTVRVGQGSFPQGPKQHFGLSNEPVGSVCLGENAERDLIIENIGPAGEDGVRIELGTVQGAVVDLCADEFDAMKGFYSAIDPFGRGDKQTIATVNLECVEGGGVDMEIIRAISWPPSRSQFISFVNDNQVDFVESSNEPIEPIHIGTLADCVADGFSLAAIVLDPDAPLQFDVPDTISQGLGLELRNAEETTFTVGETVLAGNRIVILIEEQGQEPSVDSMCGLKLAVRNMLQVRTRMMGLVAFNSVHEALGDARITGETTGEDAAPGIRVSNLGRSSDDGLVVSLGAIRRVDQVFMKASFEAAQQQAQIDMLMSILGPIGQSDSRRTSPDLEYKIEQVNDTLEVRNLFGPDVQNFFGSIELRASGEVVAMYEGLIDGTWATIAGADNMPQSYTVERNELGPRTAEEFTLRLGAADGSTFDVQIENQRSLIPTDEIAITAINPLPPPRASRTRGEGEDPPPTGFTGFEIRASGFESITILDEQFTAPSLPVDCPGDANGDLVINVADLLEVINHWGVSCGE